MTEPDRDTLAESMLDKYHLLKTNLATRQAIYHTICAKRGSVEKQTEAYKQVEQAQAELDQTKYELFEMMGIDS